MDKWDEIVGRVKNGILAEEPDAALAGALQLFAEFGRTMEMISADMDRVATVMEKALADSAPTAESEVHDL
jgi:hypothetical protein